MVSRIVRIKINIGNIYNILGDKNNAEKYWNDAIELNQNYWKS